MTWKGEKARHSMSAKGIKTKLINKNVGKYEELSGIIIKKSNDNYVNGIIDGYLFEAKVFAEPSSYGLYGGRMSKLSIYKGNERNWNNLIYNYDRGLDFATDKGKELSRKLLKVFPKSGGI